MHCGGDSIPRTKLLSLTTVNREPKCRKRSFDGAPKRRRTSNIGPSAVEEKSVDSLQRHFHTHQHLVLYRSGFFQTQTKKWRIAPVSCHVQSQRVPVIENCGPRTSRSLCVAERLGCHEPASATSAIAAIVRCCFLDRADGSIIQSGMRTVSFLVAFPSAAIKILSLLPSLVRPLLNPSAKIISDTKAHHCRHLP